MRQFDTLGYEEHDAVAWVTLDRPEVHNAFDTVMLAELRWLWREQDGAPTGPSWEPATTPWMTWWCRRRPARCGRRSLRTVPS